MKPKRMKPWRGWLAVDPVGISHGHAYLARDDVYRGLHERIVRVEVREVVPKRRRKP